MAKLGQKAKDLIILIGCVLIMATTMGIIMNVASIFYPVVAADLGVSRATFALTGTITSLSSMFAALFWGFLYTKTGIQKPMLIGIAAAGICYFGLQVAQTLLHFYLLAGLIGFLFGGISIIPVSTIITRHFTRNTGSALSIALAGSGVGPMLLNPLINTLINTQSWRTGYMLLGIILLAIALPSALIVTHLVRDEIQSAPVRAGKSEPSDQPRARQPVWFLAFLTAAFLSGFTGAGTLFNLPIYMNDLGFSVGKISIVASAYAASMVLGKFILGVLYDRVGTKTATLIAGLLMTLTCIFLMFITSLPFLVLMLITFGIGIAMGTVSITWMTNYFFGKKEYSKRFGGVQFINSLGVASGIPFIAMMLEKAPKANLTWLAVAVLSLLMLALYMASIQGNRKTREELA
jgi:Sugar phosphate permease